MRCKVCFEEKTGPGHDVSPKHLKNKALYEYSMERKKHTGNRKGVIVRCNVKSSYSELIDNADPKIKISAKPNEELKFHFNIFNDSKQDDLLLEFIQIPTNKLNFVMNNHGLGMGCEPQLLKPKTKLAKDVYITFKSTDIGQYQMPIAILFQKKNTGEKIFIARDMVVYVEENLTMHRKFPSPYCEKEVKADRLVKTTKRSNTESAMFRIPALYKAAFAGALQPRADAPPEVREIANDIKLVLETGVTEENYARFFHTLLWYEETIVRINLKKYNMSGVPLVAMAGGYSLLVPGLAEKRPSLLLGDLLFVKPSSSDEVMFEGVISEINDNTVIITGLHDEFGRHYGVGNRFDIRFFMSRLPLERMHTAVNYVLRQHRTRLFPMRRQAPLAPPPYIEFFNVLVGSNPEQRRAVERVVSGGGKDAPFLLHGPPGTGKTVTLAEMALQIVKQDPSHRVLLCTDSNMAADHAATILAQYAHLFPGKFLLRANSKYRVWETLPKSLYKYSNGTSAGTFESVLDAEFLAHRIIVTTLLHAAKFARQFKGDHPISHLLIDEAAQASEPACCVPLGGLLASTGCLVLAGDPMQLGPCVIAHDARKRGLGTSLMERLMKTELYQSENADYVVMLRNNFRSHEDIIYLPNELFYKNQLNPCADKDPLSTTCILGEKKLSRGVVFHGVLSQERRVGKSPSYFNPMELELVQKYVTALVDGHRVRPADIGVVTPYIRQVYKIKAWLSGAGFDGVEAGTVEAFQGKEKRVVIVSCVRAKHQLLDHDAKYQLGFLVDDKRFNVALTRAKAKTIVIGNPLVLEQDAKWRRYMEHCRALGTFHGFDASNEAKDARDQLATEMAPLLKGLKLNDGE